MEIIDTKLITILTEIGFIATKFNLKKEAENIFNALIEVRPDNEYPYIGLAIVMLNYGQYKEAENILRNKALKINPNSYTAKSFLGLTLKFAGYSNEGNRLLNEVIKDNKEVVSVNFAKTILSEHP